MEETATDVHRVRRERWKSLKDRDVIGNAV